MSSYGDNRKTDIVGRILASGSALPERVVENSELAAEFGVTEEWIERRCGIRRRFVAEHETATSLGAEAARRAVAGCEAKPDLLLCATYSPDRLLAPIAPAIAKQAGLGQIAAFDLNAACSGGVTAFLTGLAYISSGLFRNVLVVATDTTTRHLHATDIKTRMLFSDGAAALLLGPPQRGSTAVRIRAHRFGSDGTGLDLFSAEWSRQGQARPCVCMDGPALFRFAVETGVRTLNELCTDAEIPPACLSAVLIHQANARITGAIQDGFPVAKEHWPEILGMGNLAGASLLFLLAKQLCERPPISGDVFALLAFGAGLTWAGSILEVFLYSNERRQKSPRYPPTWPRKLRI